jgi:hypothetical protein
MQSLEFLYPVFVFGMLVVFLFVPITLIYLVYHRIKHKQIDWRFLTQKKYWRFFLMSYVVFPIGSWVLTFVVNGFEL